jgi:hypothetical protein
MRPTRREPSPHHALVVQTAPRSNDELEATLESLRIAGSDRWAGPRLVSSDGPMIGRHPTSWPVFEGPQQLGSARAFVRSLRLALALDVDLEHLTFVEDDVSASTNALDYVARTEIPGDVSLITWFTYDYDFSTPRHQRLGPHPSASRQAVLACRSTRYFILTQACTLTRATIDRILLCPAASEHWPKTHAHDELISWAIGDSLYATHFPILFQHRGGLDSAVTLASHLLPPDAGDPQSGDRTSPYYAGDSFDALSLLRAPP